VHEAAFRLPIQCWLTCLDAGGEYAFRIRGEDHMWTPDAIAKLQHATRSGKVRNLQRIREDHQ
jgi:glutamate synthase (NADPH/NADH) large chain